MTSTPISSQCMVLERGVRNAGHVLSLAASLVVALALSTAFAPPAQAATALADQPLFATKNVPGNLALLLSVEFPTAISTAYVDRTYSASKEYLGYFDPKKCYTYQIDATNGTTTVNNYFAPNSIASNHLCNTASTNEWSGNFLNWASMQTIDPFRWVLTGGYRVVDDPALTVVEKAWGTSDGGFNNFPNSSITGSTIAGATPFGAYSGMSIRIWGMGNKLRFSLGSTSFPIKGEYYNNKSDNSDKDFGGALALTRIDNDTSFITGGVSPGPGVNTDRYSVRWTGTTAIATTGTYQFQTVSDDGVRLYVNNTAVINNFTDHGSTTDTGSISLTAGTNATIVLQYNQNTGGAVIDLKWKPPGATSFTPIGNATSATDLTAAGTHYTGSNAAAGTNLEVFVRAKTCDPAVGLEANCIKYGNNYKPEGLMQFYSDKIRYSAFGYLNDHSILRDGGVLRAQQKFVGPLQPVPNSTPIANTAAEWSASTGQFTFNPDATDATNTKAIMGLPTGAEITNSGVLNYLNKFGEINASASSSYKYYDPVSELYYAALRYFRNLASVPEWTDVTGASDAQKIQWADKFPVITSPADPILYTCQRNFILGVGDTNTHADKNLPGNTSTMRSNEPPLPASVANDVPGTGVSGPVNAVDATNKVGVMEGIGGGSLGTVNPYPSGGCCNNNSTLMAGLAYAAHVNDIRGRPFGVGLPLSEPQTVDTYWVDVQENQAYTNKNQYYLAAKYGGFNVPAGYLYSNTTVLPEAQWHTNADTFGSDKRPDNYFSGGQPDVMKTGLEAAFAKIAKALGATTTSFSTPLPQLSGTDNASYSGTYDPKGWTGEMAASRLSFDTNASSTTLTEEWKFSGRLATQLSASNGWDVNRFVLTWAGTVGSGVAFRKSGSSQIDSADLVKLDTSYVAGDDKSDYVDYLRGDKSNEAGGTGKKVYRARDSLVGDIVGSKLTPNGPPSFPFSDSTNPGYAAFKTLWATRRTVVYFGANDGMLHAVNGAFAPTSVAAEKDANYGLEMFSYIPRALFQGPTAPNTDGLASLGNPGFVHHYMVNATPLVSDVDFARVPNGSNAKQNPAATVYDWHSVLMGGLGKGGKAYYAIDVTDPVSMAVTTAGATEVNSASKVLWEFSNATPGMNSTGSNKQLGYTYGDPLVMKTKKYGWVAVFTSGYNNDDGKGYFFFVNPKTGALLEMVSTNTGSTSNDAGLANAEAFIVDATDGTADAIYAGDLLGNFWRLDVTSTTGTYADAGKLVKMALLTDASGTPAAQPVTTRPAIEISPNTKKRYVMIGTGRLLDTTDISSTQQQTFYTFIDGTNASFNATPFPPASTPGYPIVRSQLTVNADLTNPIAFDPAPNAGWLADLGLDPGTPADTSTTPTTPAIPSTGIAFRIVGKSTSASGLVGFAAILPSGNVCTPSGKSRAYAIDFATGQSMLNGNVAYLGLGGVVTDLSFDSVGGRLRLLAGTDKGGNPQVLPIVAGAGSSLRRLNWRELQVVD